jgi:uncharacterized protein
MIQRNYWMQLLESFSRANSIVWLTGIRGGGKTSLCRMVPDAQYFDCDLPRWRREIKDVDSFLRRVEGKRIILDEIHRLENASEMLGVAKNFPSVRIIAASPSAFREDSHPDASISARVTQAWLTPMMSQDLTDFYGAGLTRRFLRGGLPSFFARSKLEDSSFQEWMDDFWAKDIQPLFRFTQRDPFQRFMELLFARSGELFEAVRYAAPCGVSRTTITKFLNALEATWAVLVIRPFSTRRPVEIVTAPKTYVFDTGFLCHFRGWQELREEDYRILWKHWVLNEICSRLQAPTVQYWRDKRGHEVDFVIISPEKGIVTLTGEWKAGDFDSANLRAFRYHYPDGPNWVVCGDVGQGYGHNFGRLKVDFLGLEEMVKRLGPGPGPPESPRGETLETPNPAQPESNRVL